MSYNSGVTVLDISNQSRATGSADLKSLARLLNCTPLSPIIITNRRVVVSQKIAKKCTNNEKLTCRTCIPCKNHCLLIKYAELWRPRWLHRLSLRKPVNSQMKKIRRLLQRKHDIKIKLCVRLSVLQLLHVGHVVRNK